MTASRWPHVAGARRWLGALLLATSLPFTACVDDGVDDEAEPPSEPSDEQAPVAASGLPTTAGVDLDHRPAGPCAPGDHCAGTMIGAGAPDQVLRRNGRRGRGVNSQLAVPQNLTLADVDFDGQTDAIQTAQNRLFVSRLDLDKTGVLHLYQRRPIKRVLAGDFAGSGYDQTCVIQDDNALACFGISTDRKELWWWFTQGTIVGDAEDFIVGDFNGDARDDVLVYPRAGGAWRMYSVTGPYFFGPTPGFAAGNLGTASVGTQVRAGDFDGDGRDDLALINGSGQVSYMASVWDGVANTFWWAFTTGAGAVGTNDQVTIARVDDDDRDDLVLRNRVTGATRLHRMASGLPAITNVSTGQIHAGGNSLLFWAAMHPPMAEPGASRRDDALVYDLGNNAWVRSDARWSGSQLTYWWAYSQPAPNNHAGWLPLVARNWLFLKCRFSDIATTPQADAFYRDLVLGGWGLAHFWFDTSYGAWDLYGSTVNNTWYGMSTTNAAWRALPSRLSRANACVNAYGGSTAGFVNVISLVNGEGDAGNHSGRVLMTPDISNTTFLAHETGHTFGFGHSFDDTTRQTDPWSSPGEYFDGWDIMSAMNVYGFTSGLGVTSGPGMNAPYLNAMSFIPAHRRVQLNPVAASQSRRLNLAAANRPEANGALYLRVGANNADHYTVEYRMKSGWDQAIPRSTVLIHRVLNGRSILVTGGGAERLPGAVWWLLVDGKWIAIAVNGFAAAGYTADVTVTY